MAPAAEEGGGAALGVEDMPDDMQVIISLLFYFDVVRGVVLAVLLLLALLMLVLLSLLPLCREDVRRCAGENDEREILRLLCW